MSDIGELEQLPDPMDKVVERRVEFRHGATAAWSAEAPTTIAINRDHTDAVAIDRDAVKVVLRLFMGHQASR